MPALVCWNVARAAQLYRDGRSLLEMEAGIGVSRNAVHTQLVKAGVVMRPAQLPPGWPDVSTPAADERYDDELQASRATPPVSISRLSSADEAQVLLAAKLAATAEPSPVDDGRPQTG